MKQKLLAILLALMPVLCVMGQSGTCGDGVTWTLEKGVLTISGNGPMDDFTYSYDDHYDQVKTNIPWYHYNEKVNKVIIEEDVTRIGDYAFYSLYHITMIVAPSTLTSIGEKAFFQKYDPWKLLLNSQVSLLDSEGNALTPSQVWGTECDMQTDVYVPSNLYEYYKETLGVSEGDYVCTQINIISTTTVADEPLGDNLTWSYKNGTLTISGDGIIPDYEKPSINSKYYAPGRKSVPEYDDYYVYDTPWGYLAPTVFQVVVGDGVTRIGNNAFCRMYNVEEVTLGSNVEQIGDDAFCYCENLTSVTIPASVTTIGEGAFYSDYLLEVTVLGTTPAKLGEYGFYNCSDDLVIYVPATAVADYKAAWSNYADYITYVSDIHWAFDETTGTLTISGTGAIDDYENYYDSDNNVYNYTTPWGKKYADNIKKVVIEKGIIRIGNFAFYGLSNLTEFTIPSSVTEIGECAFAYTNLTSLTLPSNMAKIGEYAFFCENLAEVTITGTTLADNPDIDAFAFYYKANVISVPYGEDHEGMTIQDDISLGDNYQEYLNEDFWAAWKQDLTSVRVNGYSYSRNSTTSRWGTVVLPVELQSNEQVTYYIPTSLSDGTTEGVLNLKQMDVVPANVPVFYRFNNEADSYTYQVSKTGTSLIEKPLTDEFEFDEDGNINRFTENAWLWDWEWDWQEFCLYLNGFRWYGDYKKQIIYNNEVYPKGNGIEIPEDAAVYGAENEAEMSCYVYLSGDQLKYAKKKLTIKPFRAYLWFRESPWGITSDGTSTGEAKTLTLSIEGENTNGIQAIMTEDGDIEDIEGIYDLNGRRLNQTQRGVNIIRRADGTTRKLIVK